MYRAQIVMITTGKTGQNRIRPSVEPVSLRSQILDK